MKFDPDRLPFWDDGNGELGRRQKEMRRLAAKARLKEVRHYRGQYVAGDEGLTQSERRERDTLKVEELKLMAETGSKPVTFKRRGHVVRLAVVK